MEAPPTYEEALAAKTVAGSSPSHIVPAKIDRSDQNQIYPNDETRSFVPPTMPAPPYSYDNSYQDNPRMVTVVMAPPQTTSHRTVIVERQSDVNHCLHCCITFLFWPWIFVWIFLCLVSE